MTIGDYKLDTSMPFICLISVVSELLDLCLDAVGYLLAPVAHVFWLIDLAGERGVEHRVNRLFHRARTKLPN